MLYGAGKIVILPAFKAYNRLHNLRSILLRVHQRFYQRVYEAAPAHFMRRGLHGYPLSYGFR